MTNDREKLAVILHDAECKNCRDDPMTYDPRLFVLADAVIAAGWRAPDSGTLLKTWYRSLTPDGKLWCETSDPEDGYLLHDTEPLIFQQLKLYETSSGWEPWEPSAIEPIERD